MADTNSGDPETRKEPIESKTPFSEEETDDVVLDAHAAQVNTSSLKLAKDGHVRLGRRGSIVLC